MINFYNSFFNKKGFLSTNAAYNTEKDIVSKGFAEINFTNKVVLEVGAGVGRLTNSLFKFKIADKAKKYILLEPSNAFQYLFELQKKNKNIKIINENFQNLENYIKYKSLDIIIAHGVIPHIESSLYNIFYQFEKYIKEDGIIYVSSTFSSNKSGANKLKYLLPKNKFIFKSLAFLTTFLQIIISYLPKYFFKYYYLNFHFSHQKRIKDIFFQQLEFYSVFPYNIHYSFKEYNASCNKNNIYINHIFPNSISFIASKNNINLNLNIKKRNKIAFYISDWHTKYIIKKIKIENYEIVDKIYNLKKYNIIILAYDYSNNPSYYQSAEKIEEIGFKFGKNLFTYQYLIS